MEQGLRRLQQEANATVVAAVSTAEEWYDALLGGARHIVIKRHLDLVGGHSVSIPLGSTVDEVLIREFERELDVGSPLSIQVCNLLTQLSVAARSTGPRQTLNRYLHPEKYNY